MLRMSEMIQQTNNMIDLMVRDIALYANMTEDEVISHYFNTANPSMFEQIAMTPRQYPLTVMLGQMLSNGELGDRFTANMLLEEKHEQLLQ